MEKDIKHINKVNSRNQEKNTINGVQKKGFSIYIKGRGSLQDDGQAESLKNQFFKEKMRNCPRYMNLV